MVPSTLLALALAFAGGTQTIHVDPVAGVDLPGNGSAAQPVKTITFAMAQIAPGNAADVRLHPGSYSEASGEIFPIVCVPDTTIASVNPLQAHVHKNMPALTRVFDVPAGTQQAHFVGLAIASIDRGIVATATSEDVLELSIEGCEISCSKAIVVKVVDGVANVRVERSALTAADACVSIDASGAAIVDAQLFGGVLTAMRGLVLTSTGPTSFVASLARQAIFDSCGLQGISVVATGGGVVDEVVEGCAFFRNALPASNPKGGAITAVINTGGDATHFVSNCAFDANGKELPNYDPLRWTVQSCFMQDAALCALATNHCGSPGFVEPLGGDFHLAPTSPAIDAGLASPWTGIEDMDGDPRIGAPLLSGPRALDIGPDESYGASLHVQPNPSTLGLLVELRVRGPSGSIAALLFSAGTNGVGFGDGLRVALPLATAPIVLGPVPAAPGGIADLSVAASVPPLPALLDVVLFEQAAFATGSSIEFGYDVVEHRFR